MHYPTVTLSDQFEPIAAQGPPVIFENRVKPVATSGRELFESSLRDITLGQLSLQYTVEYDEKVMDLGERLKNYCVLLVSDNLHLESNFN